MRFNFKEDMSVFGLDNNYQGERYYKDGWFKDRVGIASNKGDTHEDFIFKNTFGEYRIILELEVYGDLVECKVSLCQNLCHVDEDTQEFYYDDYRFLITYHFEIYAEALEIEDSKERVYEIENAIVNAYEIASRIQAHFEIQ